MKINIWNEKVMQNTTSNWLDKLLLLSPLTWFGILDFIEKSPFTRASPRKLVQSVLSIIAPFFYFSLFVDVKAKSLLMLLSPWIFSILISTTVPQTLLITKALSGYIKREPPLPSALQCLRERIEIGRCRHYGRFDVFLPEEDNNSSSEEICTGLILLPGALISHLAYTEIAARLSDLGICVVVVSMEPLRLATSYLGSSQVRLAKIRRLVQKIISPRKILSWNIGGHSLGSFAAMKVMSNDKQYRKLVLWAMSDKVPLPCNLENSTNPVLILQGSNDKFCCMELGALKEFQKKFPPDTCYETIKGASHNWFASIDQGNSILLGKASISMEKQQKWTASITAKFLAN